MARFNTDVIFIDTSGQVRAVHGDLTLRANEDGGGHVIVGSGISLRPEVNCDALDAIDLGQEIHRWKTLFACSGNFLDRPTVNGSGVLLQGEATAPAGVSAGVNSVNNLSGVITLASVNDAITIVENGQIIEFSGIFTQASGTLLENVSNLVGSGVVNRLNGLSGIINLVSPDLSIIIATSGNDILLQVDPVVLEGILTLSGIAQSVVTLDIPFQSTTSATFVDAAVLTAPIETSGFYRLFYSMQASCDQANKSCQYRVIFNKGTASESIVMDTTTAFAVGFDGALPFAGIQHGNLAPPEVTVTVDFRFAGQGVASVQLERIALEINRLGAPSGI